LMWHGSAWGWGVAASAEHPRSPLCDNQLALCRPRRLGDDSLPCDDLALVLTREYQCDYRRRSLHPWPHALPAPRLLALARRMGHSRCPTPRQAGCWRPAVKASLRRCRGLDRLRWESAPLPPGAVPLELRGQVLTKSFHIRGEACLALSGAPLRPCGPPPPGEGGRGSGGPDRAPLQVVGHLAQQHRRPQGQGGARGPARRLSAHPSPLGAGDPLSLPCPSLFMEVEEGLHWPRWYAIGTCKASNTAI